MRLGSFSHKAIKARKTATGTLKATVPARAAARRYTLLVCADTKGKVKETKETNNCRAAAAIDVVAAPAGGRRRPRRRARRRSLDARRSRSRPPPRCRPRRSPLPTATADRPDAVHDDDHRGPAGRLAAAERALRVHRQRGRHRLRVPARRRRRSRACTSPHIDPEHPRRRPRLRGPRAPRCRPRLDRPQGVADRVRGARRRPDRRARARPGEPGHDRRRRRDHARLRHHRVPLHGRQPDPEGRRARRDRGRPARPCCAARCCAATAARSTACGSRSSTTPSSAAPPRAPTAASRSPSTAAAR